MLSLVFYSFSLVNLLFPFCPYKQSLLNVYIVIYMYVCLIVFMCSNLYRHQKESKTIKT